MPISLPLMVKLPRECLDEGLERTHLLPRTQAASLAEDRFQGHAPTLTRKVRASLRTQALQRQDLGHPPGSNLLTREVGPALNRPLL